MSLPEHDYIDRLRLTIRRLKSENDRLRSDDCRACHGVGLVDGFLLGTRKRCPACDGTGIRGRRT